MKAVDKTEFLENKTINNQGAVQLGFGDNAEVMFDLACLVGQWPDDF